MRESGPPEVGPLCSASLSTLSANGKSNRPELEWGRWEYKCPESFLAEAQKRHGGEALGFGDARNWVL